MGIIHNNCKKMKSDEEYVKNDVLRVSETDKGKLVDFFLTEEIDSVEDYIDFLREVSSARADDTIRVHCNCYGGDVNVALNIFDALHLSDAYVEFWIEGMCASAATMIMLAADTWKVFPHCRVMIHAWTSWTYGKWNELKEQLKFDEKVWEPQFREIYKNFLTEAEIQQCLDGKDFWFSSEETVQRLNNFQADAMAKQDAMNEIVDKYQKLMSEEFKKIENAPAIVKSTKKTKNNKPKPVEDKPAVTPDAAE